MGLVRLVGLLGLVLVDIVLVGLVLEGLVLVGSSGFCSCWGLFMSVSCGSCGSFGSCQCPPFGDYIKGK